MNLYLLSQEENNDWGSYGNGIEAIFSNKEAAEKFVKEKSSSFGRYSIEEYEVDEEN